MKYIYNLVWEDDWHKDVPRVDYVFKQAYDAWAELGKKGGYTLLRGSARWFKNGAFTKYWRYHKGVWEKVNKPIKPDRVYDRTQGTIPGTDDRNLVIFAKKKEINNSLPVFNIPEFTELTDNKLNQSVLYAPYMPKNYLRYPGTTIHNHRGSFKVLKGLSGQGGDNVKITKSKRIRVNDYSIEQQFIPAKIKGDLRDIRVCFAGNRPVYVYNRIAQGQSLFTNVKMGATMEFQSLSSIPDLLRLSRKIMEPLQIFQKWVISLDFMINNRTGKPVLIESNAWPGTANFPPRILSKYLRMVTEEMFK